VEDSFVAIFGEQPSTTTIHKEWDIDYVLKNYTKLYGKTGTTRLLASRIKKFNKRNMSIFSLLSNESTKRIPS
jgi:hypothetical protein